METKKGLRIGCSSAFWGDSALGAVQLVKKGNIDVLVADYLAEVTMGLLAQAKQRTKVGYVGEFATSVWKPLMKEIIEKKIVVVTNAGGMDPVGLKRAIEKITSAAGLPLPIIAAISGDDLFERVSELSSSNSLLPFDVQGEPEPILPEGKMCMSFNAYLGAEPIARAIEGGAQIVLTGRCTDSALVVGPLLALHGRSLPRSKQLDFLAAASVAGHIMECGCQTTGGNFTDWFISNRPLAALSPSGEQEGGWSDMGFPVLTFFPDGSMEVGKSEGTGGVVNVGSVSEQLLYEIHDPSAYALPDVVVDFRSLQVSSVGTDRVLVKGAKGSKPTKYLKVSATYLDGFRSSAELLVPGFEAREKASAIASAIIARTRRIFRQRGLEDYRAVNVELIGSEHIFGALASPHARECREITLRLSVHHNQQEALKIFALELAPAATSMAPGITGSGSGRPRPIPLIRHFGCLVPKSAVPITITLGPEEVVSTFTFEEADALDFVSSRSLSSSPDLVSQAEERQQEQDIQRELAKGSVEVPLIALAYGRSGDKGDVANIGIIARNPLYFPFIKRFLTAEKVKGVFAHLCKGSVMRYELPGPHALNFVLTESLGGGGLGSLNVDRQGKTYAQILLTVTLPVPVAFVSLLDPRFLSSSSSPRL